MRLSCVVPVFNERANVSAFVDALSCECDKLGEAWELIMVDDGSTDGTWEEITAVLARHSNITAIRFTRNFGKEAAIQAGLRFAQGSVLVTLDADFQHPPELIRRMWDILNDKESSVRIVSATKTRRQSESPPRRLSARFFYWLFRHMSKIDLEGATDYKMLTRDVRDAYLALPESHRFYRGLTRWLGYPERSVEFGIPERPNNEQSRWSTWKLVQYAFRSLISFSNFPIRLLGWLGVATLTFSLMLGAQTLFNKISGEAVEGFTTVILVILIIGSILMIGLSVIGAYIAEIFHQVRQRPTYVVLDLIPGRSISATESKSSTEGY